LKLRRRKYVITSEASYEVGSSITLGGGSELITFNSASRAISFGRAHHPCIPLSAATNC